MTSPVVVSTTSPAVHAPSRSVMSTSISVIFAFWISFSTAALILRPECAISSPDLFLTLRASFMPSRLVGFSLVGSSVQ